MRPLFFRPTIFSIRWMIGIALGIVAALLIAPQTRWLVSSQATIALGLGLPVRPDAMIGDKITLDEVGTHPNELPLRIAFLTQVPPHGAEPFTPVEREEVRDRRDRLRALAVWFPNAPALPASVLRIAATATVSIDRDEEYELAQMKPPPHDAARYVPTSGDLAVFDQEAARGERLDPSNAFFPWMRAAGLFAGHRDAEALAALHRAAALSRWDDYVNVEMEGRERLLALRYGTQGAVVRAGMLTPMLYPQYTLLRATARVAAYLAILDERQGRTAQGIRIRGDLTRCAALMRAQSTSSLGALVAVAVTTIAAARPGGTSFVSYRQGEDAAAWYAQRGQAYCDYLARSGYVQEADWYRAEHQTGWTARQVIAAGNRRGLPILLQRLTRWWEAGGAVLLSVFWLLVISGLRFLAARASRLGIRSSHAWKTGLTVFALPVVWWYLQEIGMTTDTGLYLGIVLALASLGLPLLLLRRLPPRERAVFAGKTILIAASVIGAVFLGSLLVTRQTACVMALERWMPFADQSDQYLGLVPSYEYIIGSDIVGSGFAVPIVIGLFAVLGALIPRDTKLAGFLRGAGGASVPLACVLIVSYGVLVCLTLPRERQASDGLTQTIRYEGQYLASLTGQAWPGPVSAPPALKPDSG